MNGQRIDNDGGPLLSSHIAKALNQNKIYDCLMIREACVYRHVNIVGLHGDGRRDHTVEGGKYRLQEGSRH